MPHASTAGRVTRERASSAALSCSLGYPLFRVSVHLVLVRNINIPSISCDEMSDLPASSLFRVVPLVRCHSRVQEGKESDRLAYDDDSASIFRLSNGTVLYLRQVGRSDRARALPRFLPPRPILLFALSRQQNRATPAWGVVF